MSNFLNNAVALSLPYDSGSDEFGVMKINVNTTHSLVPLPREWAGRAVALRSFTNNVTIGVSPSASAEVDSTVAATATGATTKVGATIVAGTLYATVLPTWGVGNVMNLVVESGVANTVLEIWVQKFPTIG
jgi:hypothetical protein